MEPSVSDTTPQDDSPGLLGPLLAPLATLPGVGAATAKLLARATSGTRVADLLFHLPESVIDRRYRPPMRDAVPGRICTLSGTVQRIDAPARGSRQPWRVRLSDGSGAIDLAFFSPYQARQMVTGSAVAISGMLDSFGDRLSIANPDHIVPGGDIGRIPMLDPVWPLTAGLFPRHVRNALQQVFQHFPALPEWLDPTLVARRHWPDFETALRQLHCPDEFPDLLKDDAYAAASERARLRLACDELLAEQVAMAEARRRNRNRPGRSIVPTGALRTTSLERFGHLPTGAQTRALREIDADLASPSPMLRLVQGDVGAGKTLVALQAMLGVVEAGHQAVLMAPTEILARQHLATFTRLAPVPVAFLSGSIKGRARRAVLDEISTGRAPLVVGTHALFQDKVVFADLALAVIDEQHRFGVEQRLLLGEKGHLTDILVMTATPIPRTLLLTQWGEMQVSRLDEKPAGRLPIRTSLHAMASLGDLLDGIGRAIAGGARVFWVCPLVSESEALDIAAAEARFAVLAERFGPIVGLAHGQQDIAVREAAIADFAAGRTRILVATTVIEVGVDIPAATVMVIEHAERFGLAQLHQLRGRVGRGGDESFCLLLHDDALGKTARRRLSLLRDTEDGFLIADEDFRLRGGGDLTGRRQSGLPDLRLATGARLDLLVAIAAQDAQRIVEGNAETRRGAVALAVELFDRHDAARALRSG
ncbi:ATP-dependent DNA helicase RecG [Gluconacetobacter sp. 1b LMG 1731]|uniref:Probable DNA 3'-5' helicase RecG n=1 Tax=Gluconacetobacter dulcium TaxID=2729096 RepID=A0A7W4IIW1_9PROT|nr:ATP-dependent DNA helicase RecG [Gluconacetobacter dulcium]MBB2163720.1 ATP-dependent DNA helicase RecG [Gluconacetobacter dulcium]MBB2192866.1 ATP-dependent DNA helicase RecG [Gluconacetobacter dulcium]